jgi:hypothetical protein
MRRLAVLREQLERIENGPDRLIGGQGIKRADVMPVVDRAREGDRRRDAPGEAAAQCGAGGLIPAMLFQIEFLRRDADEPNGIVVRRNAGQFASEKDAETYGLTKHPAEADGFRILKDGAVRKTVSIRTDA